MGTLATTRMSSKGQIVIPEEVRKRLDLKTGAQFVVLGEDDIVILKVISSPSLQEFDDLIVKARREAKAAGFKQADIGEAIAKARGRR